MISKAFAERLVIERQGWVASGGWTDEQIDIVVWLQAEEEQTGVSTYHAPNEVREI